METKLGPVARVVHGSALTNRSSASANLKDKEDSDDDWDTTDYHVRCESEWYMDETLT